MILWVRLLPLPQINEPSGGQWRRPRKRLDLVSAWSGTALRCIEVFVAAPQTTVVVVPIINVYHLAGASGLNNMLDRGLAGVYDP